MIAGLGAPPSQTSAIIGTSVTAAGTAVGVATTAGWLPFIATGAAAGPIGIAIAGIAAAVGSILSAIGVGTGCGPTCVQATNIVNQIEPILQQNLDAYENGQLTQAQAQANFNQLMQYVQQSCAAIPGAAGTNCVQDRADGSCKWKQTGQPKYPGQPQLGDCWNWYNAYYYPLEQPAVNAPSSSFSLVSSSSSGFNTDLIMAAGLVIAGVMVSQ